MQWRAGEVDPDVAHPAPETWTPVDVPGRADAFAGADAVAYRTEFADPRTGAESHAVLELRGLYADATVWCNGTELATHDTYFSPCRVRLDDHLDAENDLRVVCRRPEDAFGGIYETDAIPEDAAVPGIWWDARIRTYPGPYIDALTARPELDGETGTVTVSAAVVADEAIEDRLTFSVRPEGGQRGRGMMERASVEAAAGERVTVDHSIQLRDPALWWPRELGEQHRYVIRAKFGGVERTVTTGFCDVALDSGTLTVNGTETTARGVNLLDATPDAVERAAALNANLVRAHAHAPAPEVVDACAEQGVMLWQDLPLTGPAEVAVERGQEIATALAREYGHTPALAALSVHDDPVDPFEHPLGSGLLDRLRFRWRTWRASGDHSTAAAIADALPASVPTFPVVGPPGTDADALTLYPGWRYGDTADLRWLRERYPASVVAEFGAGALGAAGDPAGFTAADRRAHERHGSDDTETSQAAQARTCRRVAEGLRQDGAAVLALFALRDTGAAGMGVYERDGTPKAATEAVTAAFEPIQATLTDPRGAESDVVVHNDLDTRFTGTLQWESPAGDGSADVTVGTSARARITTVPLPESGDTVTLTLSLSDRTVTNTYRI